MYIYMYIYIYLYVKFMNIIRNFLRIKKNSYFISNFFFLIFTFKKMCNGFFKKKFAQKCKIDEIEVDS